MSLVPFDDAQAKAVGEVAELLKTAIEAARAAGSYTASILGTLPQDLVGWAIGDRVTAARWEAAERLFTTARERLEARGVKEKAKLSPSIAAPLLDAACNESREELAELWSRLLANAMDPARARHVRLRFIEVVKKMDPMDALIFERLPMGETQPNNRDALALQMGVSNDEIEVSFNNLLDWELIARRGVAAGAPREAIGNITLTPIGRQLAAALVP